MTDIRFNPPEGGLVPHLGIELVDEGEGWMETRLPISQHIMRSTAKVPHAASLVALADTTCGFAAGNVLPEGAKGYMTIELKTNFVGAAASGALTCRAEARHLGRTTQVWDASVRHEESGKLLAEFRCTQLILAD